jgi:hypothetical protein
VSATNDVADGKAGLVEAGKKSNSIVVPAVPAKVVTDVDPASKAGTTELGSAIEREWLEAERVLEALTARTVAQVAQAIPPEKVVLVTEIADYFTALVAKLTAHAAGNGEAPVAGSDYSIPDDLSIPHFLQRGGAS